MRKASFVILALLALLFTGALPAQAHHGGHFGGGIWIGPIWPFYPYPYSYYAGPPVIIREQQPEVYIEEPQQEEQHYWYYCLNPKGYYPYVKECPDGWTKVAPRPPQRKE